MYFDCCATPAIVFNRMFMVALAILLQFSWLFYMLYDFSIRYTFVDIIMRVLAFILVLTAVTIVKPFALRHIIVNAPNSDNAFALAGNGNAVFFRPVVACAPDGTATKSKAGRPCQLPLSQAQSRFFYDVPLLIS